MIYSATRLSTNNNWKVTKSTPSGMLLDQAQIFCREDANTEQDAIDIYKSTSEPYVMTSQEIATLALSKEKEWAVKELGLADIELLQVQDGDGVGLVGDWRAFRRALRDWYHSDIYPVIEDNRPKFINTEGK